MADGLTLQCPCNVRATGADHIVNWQRVTDAPGHVIVCWAPTQDHERGITMAYKLGKRPPVIDDRTLRFGSYLKPTLPAPPPSVNYGTKVPAWPMYYNDQYGDCTCAAAGHMIQNWTANAGTEVTVPQSSVLSFYEHFVGTPPPPDEGCDMLSVLKYWRSTGLDKHEVKAFAALDLKNQTEAQNALFLTGGIYIGVALPDFATTGDMLKTPWVVPKGGPVGNAAPNPNNGHCIPAVAYDATGLTVVTWGEAKSMGWDFYDAYTDEAFAVVSEDFVNRSGETPAGFDLAAMLNDLKQL
jgi:hypothetical protein